MKRMRIGDQVESQISTAGRWWGMSKKLPSQRIAVLCAGLAVLGFACVLGAQSSSTQPSPPQQNAPPSIDQQQDQNIPDAPSTVQPPKPAPENPPPTKPEDQAPQTPNPQAPPANEAPPREGVPAGQGETPGPPPPINIRTVPEGGATKPAPGAQEELFKIVTNVNQVLIPVTVKDESGHLVNGLLPKDFSV